MRPDKLFAGIEDISGGIFSGIPDVEPVPDGEEYDEVPVVNIGTTEGDYVLAASRKRIMLFRQTFGRTRFGEISQELMEVSTKLHTFLQKKNLAFARVGFVTDLFVEDPDAGKTITGCISEKFTNLYANGKQKEARIHYGVRRDVSGLQVNDFSVIKMVKAQIANSKDKIVEVDGVGITLDINTIPERDYSGELNLSTFEKIMGESHEMSNAVKIGKALWAEE